MVYVDGSFAITTAIDTTADADYVVRYIRESNTTHARR